MQRLQTRGAGWFVAPLVVVLFLLILAAPAFALDPPWNAQPISQGLGPTYGEAWPVPVPVEEAAIASRQGAPLALMPYADFKPLLDQFQAEAAAAGVPARMTYEVLGQSAQGRDIYGVVINALETPEQVRDFGRWQTIRSMMMTDPAGAKALLASYGNDVKMCVYQSHIHGNEYEAVDSNMQVIRDLTVTPRGVNPTVDKILDNDVVVVLMDNNPDGRVNGTRGNPTGLDPNRDFFVQSQPEQQVAVAYMHRWLPTAFIEGHGYYTPTLIDGVTIPHNPGIEEDSYQHWNVQRIEQNRADFAADGVTGLTTIQSPIRDWNETGGTSTRNYLVVGTPYTVAAGPSGIANTAGGGASEVGNTVTITTSSAHNLAVGYSVTISGIGVAGYNGTWTVASIVSPTKFTYANPTSGLAASGSGTVACSAINGASESGTTATITTTTANALAVGDTVNVFGVSVAGYNGTFTVASIVSPTQFTYINPTPGLANSGGGGVTSPVVAPTATGATESGNTVTITTTANNILAEGYKVVISGVTEAGYNGTFQVRSVISPTQFTYTNPNSGLADSGGGNVALPPQPNLAQSWDDWGPFYGQSYSALLNGPDGSTVEMTSANRLLSKQAQYLAFYSSNNFWADHKAAMMNTHLENFIRGVTDAAPNPSAFDSDPVLASRFYSDVWQNYFVAYPTAYIIPWDTPQRSDTEANNLVVWLLRNNIQVTKATSDFAWNGTTYQAGSYVVWMNQALRGIAWNALAAGVDISGTKITTLYASPGAWSHGLSWGADVVEIPRGDTTFTPTTAVVTSTSPLEGGVRDGVAAPSDWYCVALRGVHEYPAIRSLLNSGIKAKMAEASFVSTTGGTMPAGTLIFSASAKAALDAAGQAGGLWFERNVGVTMPATTNVARVPKIAVLVATVPTGQSETSCVLDSIFSYDATGKQQSISRLVTSSDWDYVATNDSTGPKGLNNTSISDPLAGYDVIYTTLSAWPNATTYATSSARLTAFFARGGGFMSQNVSSAGFFTGAPTPLVTGTLTRGSQSAYGGIALVNNVGSVTSPITGPEPSKDTLFLPSTVYWYTSVPTGAVVDQRYPSNIATVGTDNGFVAGLWNNRDTAANNGPVLIHGNTTAGSRYMFYNTNAFSRADGQREWLYFVQTALWSNLTDEATPPSVTVTAPTGSADYAAGDTLPVTWNTDRPVAIGQFSIWVVSSSNGWYGGKIVAADPGSTSYADSVPLNVPTGTGYGVYVYYRNLPGDPWTVYGKAPGTFSVTAPPVITVTLPTGSASYNAGDTLGVAWNTDRLVNAGEFSIWVVSSSNDWYSGKIVAANPASTSYADGVALNVPSGSGYHAYVFYRAQPSDPWGVYGRASGTFSVTGPPVITVTAPAGSADYAAGDNLGVAWNTDRLITSGEFSIWVVSSSNDWYSGKIVAANPTSTSYADGVALNVPTGTGYHAYVFYRAQPSDPWGVYGRAPGTFSVTAPPVITVTAPVGLSSYFVGETLPVTWTTDRLVNAGEFSIWVVSSSNDWYSGKIVAANPASTSYADSVVLNVPSGVGYHVYIYYRALPGDPWVDYGFASGTVSVF